ncbi:unnamed protein product [Brachionus calyciflorus]|uniref:Uncharacterized protein n=1 Tax=Brachionus calyciflorus TaxID=104777 RepID=A0A813MQU7_9BILA|nr:unnamed protein product [Brachionus calyciflorus]
MNFLLAWFIISCLVSKIKTSSEYYEKYREMFGNSGLMELHELDIITRELFNQFECVKSSGSECFTCLTSQKLQENEIIGNLITPTELSKYSVILFCYIIDFKNFCHQNSTPNYERCLNSIAKNGTLNGKYLDNLFKNKIIPIYKSASYFNSTGLSNTDDCIDPYLVAKKYSTDLSGILEKNEQINDVFSEVIYKMFKRMKIGCDFPYQNWFVDQLFSKNYDSMKADEFKALMDELNLYKDNETKEKISTLKSLSFKEAVLRIFNTRIIGKAKRSTSENIYEKCYSPENLLQIFSLSNKSISKFDFHNICPSLVYMSSKSVCKIPNVDQSIRESTIAEKYGYGSIAIVIVSLLALIGIVLLPCFNKAIYEDILMALTSLAVGTLLSDAMLHIIPEVLGVEEDETDDDVIRVPDYAIKISVALLALYIFWLLEILVHHFSGKAHPHGHGHGHSHGVYAEDENEPESNAVKDRNGTVINGSSVISILDQTNSNQHLTGRPITQNRRNFFENLKNIKATGWMILLGDAVHNFADGMAVGASFSQSVKLGISTTIAVICHEVPHELGNYAVLVKCGFSHIQALLFNLLSATTCLMGFYVGVSVSADPEVSQWIFTVTAGMFLYISLVDLLPSVMSTKKWRWKMFFVCNAAMLLGFSVMFLLVIFESHIKI